MMNLGRKTHPGPLNIQDSFVVVVSVCLCVDEKCAPTSGWADLFYAYCISFACCVNIQIKHIIMAESRYDKYVEHEGLFIILTARIVFWLARTGQKYSRLLEWAWNVCAVIPGFMFSSLPSPTVMF